MKSRTIYKGILLAVLLLSISLRFVYYHQLNDGPGLWQHLWQDSDMNYNDRWGREIAAGDHLSARIAAPMHEWQVNFAGIYAQKYLDGGYLSPSLNRDEALFLWNGWMGKGALYQEPFYPYSVATLYKLFGDDHRNVLIFQQLVGVATLLLLFLVTEKGFGRRVALLTVLLATLYPMMIYYELLLLRESLLLFLSLLLILLTQQLCHRRHQILLLVFGLVAGIAILCKSSLALLVLLLTAGMFLFPRSGSDRRRRALPLFLILAGVIATFLPLLYRNYILGLPLLTFVTVGSFTFALHNVSAYPPFGGDVFNGEILAQMADVMSRAKFNLLATMIETIKTHGSWWEYMLFLGKKFLFLWHWFEIPNNDNFYYFKLQAPVLSLLPLSFSLLAPLATVGMVLSARHWRRRWPLYLLVATNIVLLVVFLNTSRLRMALGVSLLPFAADALVTLACMLKRRKYPQVGGICLFVLLSILWLQRPLPGGNQPIRPVDYYVPFKVYYWPQMERLEGAGKFQDAARLCSDSLQLEPRQEIDRLIRGDLSVTSNEIDFATIFYEANEKCSAQAGRAGMDEQSRMYKSRRDEIGRALDRYSGR